MAKSKLSVTLNPDRLAHAQALVPTSSVSELLDVALVRLIEEEMDRRHVAGYLETPVNDDVAQWARINRQPLGDDDNVDWAAHYGVKRP